GKRLPAAALNYELDILGYQPVKGTPQIGQYRQQGEHYEIYSKGFHFSDATEQAGRIKLTLANNHISQIQPELARLEPKIIGHFFTQDFENRRPIALTAIPETLITGLQATEDRRSEERRVGKYSTAQRATV